MTLPEYPPMTPLQLDVWAAAFALHFERITVGIDPRLTAEGRESYMERAAKLAATKAYEAARHAPGEA